MAIVVAEASDATAVSIVVDASAIDSTVVASEDAIIGRELYSIQIKNIKEIKKFDRLI